MSRFDETSAECLVFTYKEGLLSAMAHDLMLQVTRFLIEIDDETLAIRAGFDAASLKVVAAVQGGVLRHDLLSRADKQKIEQTIVNDVLLARRFPEIVFFSSAVARRGEAIEIEGELSLVGRTRPRRLSARAEGDHYRAELTLYQPDFGIKPYTAMLGTLKIKPDVTVWLTVPRAPA